MDPFEPVIKLNELKDEFIRINLEIDETQSQIRMLQGKLKTLEIDRARIKDEMVDICGTTGLTIYKRSDENEHI